MYRQRQKGFNIFIIVIVVAVVFLIIYLTSNKKPDNDTATKKEEITVAVDIAEIMEETVPTKDTVMKRIDDTMTEKMQKMTYKYNGELLDVTNGGKSSGVTQSNFKSSTYNLFVSFKDLPEPKGTDFYEGWIVRRGLKFSVLSTGRANKKDGVYTNMYSSEMDLTDHDFYVLTIEPDDGNPKPAGHILEGTMIEN